MPDIVKQRSRALTDGRMFRLASVMRTACVFVFVVHVVGGCASHVSRMMPVKQHLRAGQLEAALRTFEEQFKPDDDNLVYLFEQGLLLRYNGYFEQSNEVFEHAEQLADDLYTKSISKNIASLVTSDEVLPYEGEEFERVIVNYFRAMNYLDLGHTEDALVECRKVEAKLREYERAYEGEGEKNYRTDPFIYYLTGLIHESAGEINDAHISYKKAEQGFDAVGTVLGVERPALLGRDLVRTAQLLGFEHEAEELRARYGDRAEPQHLPEGEGEIVLFVEVGFVPMKTEVSVTLPILENERDEDDPVELARTVRGRWRVEKDWPDVHYWLKFALPAYPPSEPPPWAGVDAEGIRGYRVANLDALARASLDDRMPRIVLRAVIRAIAKYFATTKGEEAVADKHGEVAGAVFGALFNVAAVATEQADLRSWLGLPREVHMVRLAVPEGQQDLAIRLRGQGGGIVRAGTVNVSVLPGRLSFASYRFFL